MSAVVYHSQRLLVGPRIFSNLSLHRVEDLLGFGEVEVCSHDNIRVFIKAVLLYFLAEDFHVLFHFGKVCEAFLIAANVSVVIVAKY